MLVPEWWKREQRKYKIVYCSICREKLTFSMTDVYRKWKKFFFWHITKLTLWEGRISNRDRDRTRERQSGRKTVMQTKRQKDSNGDKHTEHGKQIGVVCLIDHLSICVCLSTIVRRVCVCVCVFIYMYIHICKYVCVCVCVLGRVRQMPVRTTYFLLILKMQRLIGDSQQRWLFSYSSHIYFHQYPKENQFKS